MDRPQNFFQKALDWCLVARECLYAPISPHLYGKTVSVSHEHFILLPPYGSLKASHSFPFHHDHAARSYHELDQLDQSIVSCLSKTP